MLIGLVAGVVGTLAMDLLWYRRFRHADGQGTFVDWEFTDAGGFDDVGAPGQVGKHVAGILGIEIPDDRAGLTNDLVHWSTGIGWGTAAALVVPGSVSRSQRFAAGLGFGVAAFSTAYATLAPLGIYQPIWEYDAETLFEDLTAHLLFGTGVGIVLACSDPKDTRAR